jgi:hypothetical protein
VTDFDPQTWTISMKELVLPENPAKKPVFYMPASGLFKP